MGAEEEDGSGAAPPAADVPGADTDAAAQAPAEAARAGGPSLEEEASFAVYARARAPPPRAWQRRHCGTVPRTAVSGAPPRAAVCGRERERWKEGLLRRTGQQRAPAGQPLAAASAR